MISGSVGGKSGVGNSGVTTLGDGTGLEDGAGVGREGLVDRERLSRSWYCCSRSCQLNDFGCGFLRAGFVGTSDGVSDAGISAGCGDRSGSTTGASGLGVGVGSGSGGAGRGVGVGDSTVESEGLTSGIGSVSGGLVGLGARKGAIALGDGDGWARSLGLGAGSGVGAMLGSGLGVGAGSGGAGGSGAGGT